MSFKQLGLDTHTRFDQMALDAEQLGDREHTLSQLSSLLQNCVACHAAYRIASDP
jgi:cytochrome c556